MATNQHPVPQPISSYEFKLVGDMTLKQFFQVGGGILIAFLVWATPLPVLIKVPLVVIPALLGIALAFVPLYDRPLTAWFLAFFKAVYSPTLYNKVRGAGEKVFTEDRTPKEPPFLPTHGEEQAMEYLSKIPQPKVVEKFEKAEEEFLKQVVYTNVATVQSNNGTKTQKNIKASQYSTITPPPAIFNQKPQSYTVKPRQSFGNIKIPTSKPIKIHKPTSVTDQKNSQTPTTQQSEDYNFKKDTFVKPVFSQTISIREEQQKEKTQEPVFTPEAAPPNPPDIPNVVVGQVVGPDGKIVEGAILEIREVNGLPVRAIRTNKVGHFITVTPLKNGEYEIITEKEGLSFDIIKFKAEGRVIPPILIKGRVAKQ